MYLVIRNAGWDIEPIVVFASSDLDEVRLFIDSDEAIEKYIGESEDYFFVIQKIENLNKIDKIVMVDPQYYQEYELEPEDEIGQ